MKKYQRNSKLQNYNYNEAKQQVKAKMEALVIAAAEEIIQKWGNIDKDGETLHAWLVSKAKDPNGIAASDVFNLPEVHEIIERHCGDMSPILAKAVVAAIYWVAQGNSLYDEGKLQ